MVNSLKYPFLSNRIEELNDEQIIYQISEITFKESDVYIHSFVAELVFGKRKKVISFLFKRFPFPSSNFQVTFFTASAEMILEAILSSEKSMRMYYSFVKKFHMKGYHEFPILNLTSKEEVFFEWAFKLMMKELRKLAKRYPQNIFEKGIESSSDFIRPVSVMGLNFTLLSFCRTPKMLAEFSNFCIERGFKIESFLIQSMWKTYFEMHQMYEKQEYAEFFSNPRIASWYLRNGVRFEYLDYDTIIGTNPQLFV